MDMDLLICFITFVLLPDLSSNWTFACRHLVLAFILGLVNFTDFCLNRKYKLSSKFEQC